MENSEQEQLEALGHYALRFAKPGDVLGLGTGHAATAFINALGASLIQVRGVPTSRASEELGRSLGIEIVSLADTPKIDTDFDGADEVDPKLNLIKGYGGALVREKIVATAARRLVIVVGGEKLVPVLGTRGIVPVEVIPFALPLCRREIRKLGLVPQLRLTEGDAYQSDNGNHILDCATEPIGDARALDLALRSIPGVVGTGIFAGLAAAAVVGDAGGVRLLERGVRY